MSTHFEGLVEYRVEGRWGAVLVGKYPRDSIDEYYFGLVRFLVYCLSEDKGLPIDASNNLLRYYESSSQLDPTQKEESRKLGFPWGLVQHRLGRELFGFHGGYSQESAMKSIKALVEDMAGLGAEDDVRLVFFEED